MSRFAPLLALVAFTHIGCPPTPDVPTAPDAGPTPPPAPPGAVDGGTPAGPCEAAFQRGVALGCAPLGPVGGGSWADACNTARMHGIDLHTACRIQAVSCVAMAACDPAR